MIINPELGRMSIHDLNQRYQSSFVMYDGRVIYVNGFHDKNIIYSREKEGGVTERFDYKKLDITRPKPKWVQIESGFYYFAYSMERQFLRGFSSANCTLHLPANQGRYYIPKVNQRMVEQLYKTNYKRRWKVDEICAELEKKNTMGVLLSSQILLHYFGEDHLNLYYREAPIGSIHNVMKEYEQELKETIEDIRNESYERLLQSARKGAEQVAGARPKAAVPPKILGEEFHWENWGEILAQEAR